MLYRLLIVVFLCLCATSASGKVEELTVGAVLVGDDDWAKVGGAADKPASLNDDLNTTYIASLTLSDNDRYECEDLSNTDIEEIDSVQVIARGREQSNGNNKVQFYIVVGSGNTNGVLANLNITWETFTSTYTAHPEGGDWTESGVDSMLLGFDVNKNATANWVDSVRVLVYYKSSERTLMFPEKDDACLTTGAGTFDHDLRRKSAMQNDTGFIQVPDLTPNKSTFWKTGDAVTEYHKMNNDEWETGGFGVFLDVVHVKSDCSLKVRIQRYNSSCVLQESSPYHPASGAKLLIDTTGHYEFQIPQFDWSSGACGDELVVDFNFSNDGIGVEDSIWIRYGTPYTYFEHEIVINFGCDAEKGAGDCTNTVAAVPNQLGGLVEWAKIGGGGGTLIDDIADNIDANYMFEVTNEDTVQFQMQSISDPGDLDTYDSVTIEFRAQRNTAKKLAKIIIRVADSTNPTTEYCESGKINIQSTSWTDFTGSMTIFGAPSTAEACEGAFSASEINGWEISFYTTSLDAGKEVRVTSVDIVVCYTVTGGGEEQNFRRIRLIKLGKLDDKTIWDTYFEQELAVNDKYETLVTFGFPSQGWVWGG